MEPTSILQHNDRRFRQDANCIRSTGKSLKEYSGKYDGNAFLKFEFSSFWSVVNRNCEQTQSEFFQSVDNLCSLYDWDKPLQTDEYPSNVYRCYKEISERLLKKGFRCIIDQDDQDRISIASAKPYEPSASLFYLQVRPVYLLSREVENKKLADLFILIFTYLYSVTTVPYFRNEGNLQWRYHSLKNQINPSIGEDIDFENEDQEVWDDDDILPDGEEKEKQMTELEFHGDKAKALFDKPFRLSALEKAVGRYAVNCKSENNMLQFAHDFLQFVREYPSQSIKDKILPPLNPQEDEYIDLEDYLSFNWTNYNLFFDDLMYMVNEELGEKDGFNPPHAIQRFDTPQESESHSFDYEDRLFHLLERLSTILDSYDYERRDIQI